MLSYFIIGTALLIALIIGGNALVSAKPSTILKTVRITALILLSAGAAFMAFTGRFNYASALAFAALFFLRNKPLFSSSKPSPGQSSSVTTEWLDASLDHDSGEMNAKILKGDFSGHTLSDLSLEQLNQLRQTLTIDQESLAILDAFISRNFEGNHQEETSNANSGTQNNPNSGAMSRSEAYDVLGLTPTATLEDIKAAHKKLMKKFHPDHDGSAYMAAKINQARDILINS
jgi:hypothetical protein